MNLEFKALCALFSHQSFVSSVLPSSDIFFVGGAIRDVLLGKTTDPVDIDYTCAGDPETLRNHIDKNEIDGIDRFRTEKFGTISLIKRENNKEYIYELTPFRTEGAYTDVRHPDQLEWSDSLLSDSKRRDFTINCLYRYGINQPRESNSTRTSGSFETALKQKGAILIDNTLVVRNHEQIETLIPQGTLDEVALKNLLDKAIVVGDAGSGEQLSIIFDPHGGVADLVSRTIVTVGNATERFEEDALRVMRGARFVISLNENLPGTQKENSGFDFRRKTRDAMVASSHLVKNVSFERINQEITKVFSGSNPFGYISILNDLGLIEYIFPSLHACIGNDQPTRHHPFDTYAHTILTLHALQSINDDYRVKLAMLYHDVGKPEQYAFMEKAIAENPESPDRSGFEHHADISVVHAKKEFKRLCFPKKDIEAICWYIKWHHRPGEILGGSAKNGTKKLRQLLSEGGIEKVLNLIDIAISDRLGQFNPIQAPVIEELKTMKITAQKMFDSEGRFTMKELVVNGAWLMETFTITQGPDMGILLGKIFDWVIADIDKRNKESEIKAYVKGIL